MNKKGYTLAEALITLGIIGIIAALVVPAANKARPNENKMKFLQTYDAIETQIKNFTQNSRYFPTCQDFRIPDLDNAGNQRVDGNGNLLFLPPRCFPDYPLYNTSGGVVEQRNDQNIPILISTPGSNPPDRPLPANYNFNTDGPDKLCYLLADAMDAITDMAHRCGNNIPSFVTPNGVAFRFDNNDSIYNNNQFLKIVVFDVNGDVQNENVGGEDPSTFIIAITADGSVYPNDTASIQYLANRKDTKEKFNNADWNRYQTINPLNDLSNDSRVQIIFSN